MNSQSDRELTRDYRDLNVWKVAMDLTVDVYSVTRRFPREELFGLVTQMRRAAGSIPANIAEGFGREQTRSCIHFLRIAQGSLKELETHVILAERVQLLDPAMSMSLMNRSAAVGRMLPAYIRALVQKLSPDPC